MTLPICIYAYWYFAGHNGIAAFFRNHKCNTFCRYMKIHSHRLSNQVISAAPQFTVQIFQFALLSTMKPDYFAEKTIHFVHGWRCIYWKVTLILRHGIMVPSYLRICSGILSVDMPLPDRPAVREYRRVRFVLLFCSNCKFQAHAKWFFILGHCGPSSTNNLWRLKQSHIILVIAFFSWCQPSKFTRCEIIVAKNR